MKDHEEIKHMWDNDIEMINNGMYDFSFAPQQAMSKREDCYKEYCLRLEKAWKRVKAENEVLKDERKILFETIREMKMEFLKDHSYQKTAAMALLYARLQNRRLI
jgi:hypothetical protein